MNIIEKIKNMDETKRNRAMKIALVIEVCLMAMFIGIIVLRNNPTEHKNQQKVSATEVPVSVSDSYDSMTDIYKNLLVGHSFVSKKTTFSFEKDGSYKGYFDKKNKKVEDAKYKISYTEKGPVVVITYKDDSKTYAVSFSEDYNVTLSSDKEKFKLTEK